MTIVYEAQGITTMIVRLFLSLMQYFMSIVLEPEDSTFMVANANSYPVKLALLQPPTFSY